MGSLDKEDKLMFAIIGLALLLGIAAGFGLATMISFYPFKAPETPNLRP